MKNGAIGHGSVSWHTNTKYDTSVAWLQHEPRLMKIRAQNLPAFSFEKNSRELFNQSVLFEELSLASSFFFHPALSFSSR